MLCLVALRRGQATEAHDALRKSAEQAARPAVLHNLAVALEQTGRLAEAESAFEVAAERDAADPRILVGWGIVALRAGRGARAAELLDRARAVLGDRTPPALWYWARGLAALIAGRPDEAVPLLEEGVERHPHCGTLRNNLAVLYEHMGAVDRAEQVLRLALEEDPSLPQLWKNLGDLLYRTARTDEAELAYGRALKLAPHLGDDTFFKLGNIAFQGHRPDAAAEYWREAVALNPEHQMAKANLATIARLGSG
jgi:protein O-GlcNAc transferase